MAVCTPGRPAHATLPAQVLLVRTLEAATHPSGTHCSLSAIAPHNIAPHAKVLEETRDRPLHAYTCTHMPRALLLRMGVPPSAQFQERLRQHAARLSPGPLLRLLLVAQPCCAAYPVQARPPPCCHRGHTRARACQRACAHACSHASSGTHKCTCICSGSGQCATRACAMRAPHVTHGYVL